jgi:transforming growth factor-beta-induced protein
VRKMFLAWLVVTFVFAMSHMAYTQDAKDDQDNDFSSEIQEGEEVIPSIMETLSADDRFSIFVEALEKAGLSEMLDEDGMLTVFAPTDSAFNKIPAEELDRIMGDRKILKEIISGHIVDDELWTTDLAETDSVETINNKSLTVTEVEKLILINGIPIIDPDIECDNGVIQVIDSVILPAPGD